MRHAFRPAGPGRSDWSVLVCGTGDTCGTGGTGGTVDTGGTGDTGGTVDTGGTGGPPGYFDGRLSRMTVLLPVRAAATTASTQQRRANTSP